VGRTILSETKIEDGAGNTRDSQILEAKYYTTITTPKSSGGDGCRIYGIGDGGRELGPPEPADIRANP